MPPPPIHRPLGVSDSEPRYATLTQPQSAQERETREPIAQVEGSGTPAQPPWRRPECRPTPPAEVSVSAASAMP